MSGAELSSVPLPKFFLPLKGVEWARPLEASDPVPHDDKPKVRPSPAQKAGLLYQRKVESEVALRFSAWEKLIGPWFAYTEEASNLVRYCQPDMLLMHGDSETALVVEIKSRWTSDAWWQVRKMYEPVVQSALEPKSLFSLCICGSFDPSVRIGERVHLVDGFGAPLLRDAFNVLVWRT